MTVINPRIGRLTRALAGFETSRGVDPGSPASYVLNLCKEATFARKSTTTAAELFKGSLQPDDQVYDPYDASGTIPQWFDLDTAPIWFKASVGSSGYTVVALASGNYLHIFAPPTGVSSPLSLYIQYEFLQSTVLYARNRNVGVKTIKIPFQLKGPVPMDVDLVATGDEVQTDIGGTKTDLTALSTSPTIATCFNGQAKIAGLGMSAIKSCDFTVDLGSNVEQVAMNGGIAGCWWSDAFNTMSTIELLLSTDGSNPSNNFNLLAYANAQTPISLEYTWTNLAIAAATKWCNVFQPKNVPTAETPTPGGKGPRKAKAKLTAVNRASTCPGFSIGMTLGPYAIVTGTNDIFSVKPDGGSTINVTLTAGAARTTDQIVNELNLDSTFNVKLVADNFNGRVRVTSLETGGTGSASSVQFITGTLHHCGTTLGFVGTAIAGTDGASRICFVNQVATY